MKAKLVSLALLAIMISAAITVLTPVYAYPANAMWITPTTINGATVGYLNSFNVTVWLNTTKQGADNGINAWQFYMIYKSALLNATACDYTGVGKSLWSNGFGTVGVIASFGTKNATYNYIVFSEVLGSSRELIASNSIAYVTFKIIKAAGKFETLTSDIRLDNPGAFKTQLKDAAAATFIPTCYPAVYTWVWVQPAKATFLISPGTETFGGTAVPIPAGFKFNETVQANVDVGWGCINASFVLVNDNTTLLTITNVYKGSLWGSMSAVEAPTGTETVSVKNPSSTPSGIVDLAKIEYQIMEQGIQPRDYIAHLSFDNSSGLVYLFDAPDAKIPVNTPLPTATITVAGLVTKFPGALQVSSATLGPNPVIGQLFNITVKIINLHNYWCLIGLDFRLAYDPTLIQFITSYEGPFLPYYATPPSLGTWWYDTWQPAFPPYPEHDLVGNLILPNGTGWWPTAASLYPDSNATDSTVAILTFKVLYQSFGEQDITSYLNIINSRWVGIDPTTLTTTQIVVDVPFAPARNGTYTITTILPGRMIDLYTQYPAPYGGQGLNQPSDMFWPQKQVELYANVTYNFWPVQQKDVAFEVRDPSGLLWTQQVARSDVNGVAHTNFRIPWPCDHPETLFGVWTVKATVDLYCIVVNDTLRFHFDYLVEIFKVTTDKFQYNHCDNVKVTVTFGTHAQQKYPLLLYVVIYDNVNVPVGIGLVNMTIGGTVYCQYKNYTESVCIHIPKFAAAGIATVIVNAYNKLPSMGGSAYCPTFGGLIDGGENWPIGSSIPTIAIQPY